MALTIQLPPEIESALRQYAPDLNQAAKEALLVKFYRQGGLSHHQLCQALELTRYETDGVLKRHGVSLEVTGDDIQRQMQSLRTAADQRLRFLTPAP